MWREADLALTGNISTLNCAITQAHPWIYGLGQQTDGGAYLSPGNAIDYLAGKLKSQAPREVVIFMTIGTSHQDFIQRLGSLADVFPAPAFNQVKRLAQSAAQLIIERMQIPAPYAGLAEALPLSVPTMRQAISAAKIKAAAAAAEMGFDVDSTANQLSEFSVLRDKSLNAIQSGLTDLQGKSARAWVFTASGDITTALKALRESIPLPSAVHSAAMMMGGDDLSAIRSMIHDIRDNAGA